MNEQRLDKPDNVVVVLMDSLNRHLLGAYGGTEFETPNLDAFAARSVRFDKHYAGSLPCMPARHDILCGALDFLWRPWGSIELWESAITVPLRDHGVTTMLVSDHPHLFETGGENYHTDFHGWDYLRGGESDPWRTRPDPSWIGAPALPVASFGPSKQYNLSRTWFRSELDFPGPKTMRTAADWLRSSAGFHDRFLLFVDEFDPHEPFDTPAPWAGQYDPDWRDPIMIWPPYAVSAVASGVITERQARHVRANYGSKLSMIDYWFGKVLEALEDTGLTESTAVILCTDHGHYLGERDLFGKPHGPALRTDEPPAADDFGPRAHSGDVQRPHHQRGHPCHAGGHLRSRHRAQNPRLLPVAFAHRRAADHSAMGTRRRLGWLGARAGRASKIRPLDGRRRQPAAIALVESLVDPARLRPHHQAAETGPSRPTRIHARLGRPGDVPVVPAWRPVAALGDASSTQ